MPKIEIPASVYLAAEVEVFPARLPLPGNRSSDMERRFAITNNSKNPILLMEPKSSNPAIKLSIEEVRPGFAFNLKAAIPNSKNYKISPSGDVISVKTDSKKTPLVSVIITEAKNVSPFGAPINVTSEQGPQAVQGQEVTSTTDQPKQ